MRSEGRLPGSWKTGKERVVAGRLRLEGERGRLVFGVFVRVDEDGGEGHRDEAKLKRHFHACSLLAMGVPGAEQGSSGDVMQGWGSFRMRVDEDGCEMRGTARAGEGSNCGGLEVAEEIAAEM